MNSLVAIALLAAHQLPTEVARTVALDTADGLTGNAGVVTIGYDQDGKRKITAQVLLPTLADAERLLADRDGIAALIAQGVRAMPAVKRPALPTWVAESAEAKRAEDMQRRVTAIATAAIAANDADLPWAA